MVNTILKEEIFNRNQVILHLVNGGWKAYGASACNLSELLGDTSCQMEIFQNCQVDVLCISHELLIQRNLVDYCSLLEDEKIILDMSL